MVTLDLYCGLKTIPKASATFPDKVIRYIRYSIPLLAGLGLQDHQTWVAGSLDLCPKNAPYGLVQRSQKWGTWRKNDPESVLCQIYFIKAWVVFTSKNYWVFAPVFWKCFVCFDLGSHQIRREQNYSKRQNASREKKKKWAPSVIVWIVSRS